MDSNIRILAVDDEPDIRQLLRILLENRGYQVTEASSGEEALRSLRTDPSYDLILMDIMMPVMDGLTATRTIRILERQDAKTIPIIAMTANAFREDAEKCMEAGMNAHLSKPIVIEEVIKTILRYVHND